jgi:hypothetical protein
MDLRIPRAVGAAGARFLDTEEVTGSIPVPPTIGCDHAIDLRLRGSDTGVVRTRTLLSEPCAAGRLPSALLGQAPDAAIGVRGSRTKQLVSTLTDEVRRLSGVAGQPDGPVEGRPRLLATASPAQQVGADGVKGVATLRRMSIFVLDKPKPSMSAISRTLHQRRLASGSVFGTGSAAWGVGTKATNPCSVSWLSWSGVFIVPPP